METIGWQDGGKIRALREQRGFGLGEFARHIQVGKASLSAIELGYTTASIGMLIRIARGLGVTVDELLRADAGNETGSEAA